MNIESAAERKNKEGFVDKQDCRTESEDMQNTTQRVIGNPVCVINVILKTVYSESCVCQ